MSMDVQLQFNEQAYREDKDFKRYFDALQLMANRMAMSHFKYGVMKDNVLAGCDDMKGGRQRLWMYDGIGDPVEDKPGNTGNTENLLDAANFFVIEYLFPRHKNPHFQPQTTEQSPGLAWQE